LDDIDRIHPQIRSFLSTPTTSSTGGLFCLASLPLGRCRGSGGRNELHHDLVPVGNRTPGGFHSFQSGLDLLLARLHSGDNSRGIVGVGTSFCLVVLLGPQRRVGRQPALGFLLLGLFLAIGGLSSLAVDLFFDLHRRGLCFLAVGVVVGIVVVVGSGKPASCPVGGGPLRASRGDGAVGHRCFLGLGVSLAIAILFRVLSRRSLGLFLSSVGDDVV